MNEWELIKAIAGKAGGAPGGDDTLLAGIGDDCAVFRIGVGRCGLITTDISVEHVHFERRYCGPEDIGYKAMAANISDIAAMGGSPLFAFISLGIPDDTGEEYVLGIYEGMRQACTGLPLRIAGGDLSRSGELILNIALYGEVNEKGLVTRKGAKPGDTICVTGTLGDAEAGMAVLLRGDTSSHTGLTGKHLRPPVRIGALPAILAEFSPAAMIDVSDGLLSDLRHLCEAGGAGFVLDAESIPVSKELAEWCAAGRTDPLDCALRGGEEYELLFATPRAFTGQIELPGTDVPVTAIGRITSGGFSLERNGTIEPVEIRGYEHFGTRETP